LRVSAPNPHIPRARETYDLRDADTPARFHRRLHDSPSPRWYSDDLEAELIIAFRKPSRGRPGPVGDARVTLMAGFTTGRSRRRQHFVDVGLRNAIATAVSCPARACSFTVYTRSGRRAGHWITGRFPVPAYSAEKRSAGRCNEWARSTRVTRFVSPQDMGRHIKVCGPAASSPSPDDVDTPQLTQDS